MDRPEAEKARYVLEKQQVFSRCLLWDLQRRYFSEKGIDAWRQGDVPHYITNNPMIANCYAEIVFAFLRDQDRLVPCAEPLQICELGGGSGRFAYHFLKRLTRLLEQANLPPNAFRYVLTDSTPANVDYWRQHSHFQPFFRSNLLDVALFDANDTDRLTLQLSNQTIAAGSLERPLVVIANYVLDTVPQELFYIDAHGCHQCVVTLWLEEDPNALSTAELLARLHIHYEYMAEPETPYQESYLQHILDGYQQRLTDTYLLFPMTGLRCLQRLKALSKSGLMLLSADKGNQRLSDLQGKLPPDPARHGSFSLPVNFHAFKTFCEEGGGITLFPAHPHNNININCLLLVDTAGEYVETERAYRTYVHDFGPDDFFNVAKHARQHVEEMTTEDILAYVRLSHYDGHLFSTYLARLREQASALTPNTHAALLDTIEKVWDMYFPIGESFDLAYQIGVLVYDTDDYTQALTYFEHSLALYGQQTGTLYNMALCYRMLDQHDKAIPLLRKVVASDPDHKEARAVLLQEQKMAGTPIYPILVEPTLAPKVWGGRQLATRLHKAIPPGDPIGESWEIYWRNKVSNGPYRGQSLGDVIAAHPMEMMGTGTAEAEFPLLIKFLDAQDWLSVQVHPDDRLAMELEGEPRGKTECWYIVDAAPGAQLVYGFAEAIDAEGFRRAIAEKRVKDVLQYVTVAPGDFIYMPAGMLHALGPGLLIYELQQTSDTTYRVYDWDRLGLDGKPRDLHLEKALTCTRFEVRPKAKTDYKSIAAGKGIEIAHLVKAQYFSLDRIRLSQKDMLRSEFTISEEGLAHCLTVTAGRVSLTSLDATFESVSLSLGQSVFVPAEIGTYRVDPDGDAEILQAIMPE